MSLDTGSLEEKVIAFFISSPPALVTLCVSFVSGHMWTYVIFTYWQKKSNAEGFFDGKIGKTILGFCWVSLITLPFYFYDHHTIKVVYDDLLASIYSILLISLFIQTVIFMIITVYKRAA